IVVYTQLADQSWMHGQLKRAVTEDSTRVALAAATGGTINLDGLFSATADIILRGRQADGVKKLDAIVVGQQFTTAAPIDRPYRALADLYARAGRPDRARDLLKRFDTEDGAAAHAPDAQIVTRASEGEIALAEKFVDQWKGADPELQPVVTTIRKRIVELVGQEGH
ncbi:MAG: hypothetical protein ACRELE_02565, partial [Gemmatimonadales bacterium]